MRRKMAEFLVKDFLPLSAITEIGVYSEDVATRLDLILSRSRYAIRVNLNRTWYY